MEAEFARGLVGIMRCRCNKFALNMKVSIDLHGEVSLVNVQKSNLATPGQTPQQDHIDLAALYAKSNAPDMGASNMVDNFRCARMVVAVSH
jgi:hypothetical protein